MIKLIFYEKKPGNLYLTKCYATEGEDEIQLPSFVPINGKNRRYSIYQYAFWGERNIKTLYIPKTINSINAYSFAGSYIQSVYLLAQGPTSAPPPMSTLYSKSVPITFYYPQGAREAYNNRGWRTYRDTQTNVEIVRVAESGRITEDNTIHIPSLHKAGAKADNILLNMEINQIDDMAYLGVAPTVITTNYFDFLNTVETSNDYYSIELDNLVEISTNKLIKGLCNFNTVTNNTNVLNYDILGPNCFYKHPQLSNQKYSINIRFNGSIIDSLAFQKCQGLKTCIVSDAINYIASDAFMDCNNLTSVSIANTSRAMLSYQSLTLDKYTNCCLYSINSDNSYYNALWFSKVIPLNITIGEDQNPPEFYTKLLNHMEEIPAYLFKDSKLTGVLTIPANIKKIGQHAFDGCQNLLRVECAPRPDGSPLIIEDYAFYNCNNIETYVLPNTSAQVGYRALAIGEEYEQ